MADSHERDPSDVADDRAGTDDAERRRRRTDRLRAEGARVAGEVADLAEQRIETEEAVAVVFVRIARLRPEDAERLRGVAAHARDTARQEREHVERWRRYSRKPDEPQGENRPADPS
jgi:hypothetical protein